MCEKKILDNCEYFCFQSMFCERCSGSADLEWRQEEDNYILEYNKYCDSK